MQGVDPRIVAAFNAAHDFKLEDSLILLGRIGSHSHGTYVPPTDPDAIDDVDYLGLVIPPVDYLVGLKEWEHWVWKDEELDVVMYSLSKAARLLLKSNPNVLGLLWLRDEDYVYQTSESDLLRECRGSFSSLRAYPAFMGYAYDQLKRMTTWDEARATEYQELWNLVAQSGPPERYLEMNGKDFDHWVKNAGRTAELLDRVRQLRALHRKYFSGYMGDKRKALVRKYGYDTKNAAHLIRLMRMCVGFLQTGALEVYRATDGDEIRAIKRGEWSLDAVKAEADRLFAEAALLKDTSPLPVDPDERAVNALVKTLQATQVAEWVEQLSRKLQEALANGALQTQGPEALGEFVSPVQVLQVPRGESRAAAEAVGAGAAAGTGSGTA